MWYVKCLSQSYILKSNQTLLSPSQYKTKDGGGVEHHSLKLEAADQAAVFQK